MLGGPDYDTAGKPPHRTHGGVWPTFLLLVLIAGGVLAARHYFGDSSSASGDDEAAADGRPVLLMFTADWCGPCQTFKARVLADDRVSSRVKASVRFQKVDLTSWKGDAAATASHYGVTGVPQLILVNTRGQEIDRYHGPANPDQFARWLERHAYRRARR
jgi:thiol:disulfide interchange protein